MTIQQKHVNVNLAAEKTARMMHALADLSHTATVVLFRMMVLNEGCNVKSDVFKELLPHGFVNNFGYLKPWVAGNLGESIDIMLAEAGCDLMPQDKPTSMRELGHKMIKGKSKAKGREVYDATRIMLRTGFEINRDVWRLAASYSHLLDKQDKLVLNCISMLPEVMYFPVSFDYRGRMYYRGGIFTPQGSDFLKGLLQFSEKQPIGEHGKFALAMAYAEAAGFKGTKKECWDWATNITHEDHRITREGDNGFQAYGLRNEMDRLEWWIKSGFREEDFESGVICHMDATCSGLQIAAAITGHRRTAEVTNCTARHHSQGKADVYGVVAEKIALSSAPVAEYAAKYGRDLAKKPVMVLGYGAGEDTICRNAEEFLADKGHYLPLNSIEDLDIVADAESRKAFIEAVNSECEATVSLKEQLQQVAKGEMDPITWTTHDGFQVIQEKKDGDEEKVGNFSMTFNVKYSQDLNITAIAPNFVHSLDAAQMREAVRKLDRPVACIHDSLGVRPGDYMDAARAVREAFVAIDARRIAQEFLNASGLSLQVLGDYEASECLESSYFWC